MDQISNRLAAAGGSIPCRVGPVLIDLRCIRPNAAYRVSVCYGSTGAEIDELSRSFATETEARDYARGWAYVFTTGARVVDVLDVLAATDRLVTS